MATSKIVITYDAASGEVGNKVTSFTVGGTAYASLTATPIRLAADILEQSAKLISSPSQISTVAAVATVAVGRFVPVSDPAE
jgi:hypothetical protein